MHRCIPQFFLLTLLCLSACKAYGQEDSLFISEGYEVLCRHLSEVNSEALDFSPAWYLNGVVFCSSRNGKKSHTATGNPVLELFYADILPDGRLGPPTLFSPHINSQINEGPSCFSPDGETMYFTRNNSEGRVQKADKDQVVRLKVYTARKGLFEWESPEELPFNSNEYSAMHPAISADGRRLYFASDMPGGYGQMDLYVVHRQPDGSWGLAQNLGPKVNTERHEAFPYLFHDQWLFFASNRPGGQGGYDLYMASLDEEGPLRSLAPPFNSEGDDLGFILHPTGKRGYFTSSRVGGQGLDDLYYFETPAEYWGERMGGNQKIRLIVEDENTGEGLAGAALRLFQQTEKGFESKGGTLYEEQLLPATSEKGAYSLERVRPAMGPPDKLTDPDGMAALELKYGSQYLLQIWQPGYGQREFLLSLDALQTDSVLRIGLVPAPCQTLPGRLITEGGRTVRGGILKIQSVCLENSETFIRAGEQGYFSFCFRKGCDYLVTGILEGFVPDAAPVTWEQIARPESDSIFIRLFPDEKPAPIIKEGTVIILENIYYDFNKSAIRTGAAKELDQLARLMLLYPSMEVELVSHTDSRGEKRYNKELSERRSESARDYLMSKGVRADRIRTAGKGESEIRNRCSNGVDCSEEEHQFNRRTEVIVTRFEEKAQVQFRYGE